MEKLKIEEYVSHKSTCNMSHGPWAGSPESRTCSCGLDIELQYLRTRLKSSISFVAPGMGAGAASGGQYPKIINATGGGATIACSCGCTNADYINNQYFCSCCKKPI